MPVNPPTLPELPAPSDKAGSWPTFSLSLTERRAIGNGTVSYSVRNVTGQPSRFLAATQSANRPGPLLPAQQPIRSTARNVPAPLQRPFAKGYASPSAPLRSTAPGVSAVTPLPPPWGLVPARQRLSGLSIFSLILACGSLLALIFVPFVLAQSVVPWIVFISAFVALLIGMRAAYQRGAASVSKAIAAGGITLSLLSIVFEIIRLIAHV